MAETHDGQGGAGDSGAWIDPALIKLSDWPSNIIPENALAFSSESDGCTVKGFYDPATGEMHVQEICNHP